MNSLRFVPDHAIAGIPNVVVDGAPNTDTRLTLSHWPGAPTPPDLRDDLSEQIAFHALDRPDLFDRIEAVTNNHFDQDGLVSAFALLHPVSAQPRATQGTLRLRCRLPAARRPGTPIGDDLAHSRPLSKPTPLSCATFWDPRGLYKVTITKPIR